MLKEISKRRFDAYCYVRSPMTMLMSREVAGFEAFDRKLLALIIFDLTDKDFGFIVLGRDVRKLFRAIEVSDQFYSSPEEAIEALSLAIKKYENDGREIYPQGDEIIPPNEIFEPQVAPSELHPYFKTLAEEPRFEAARNLVREIAYSFTDVDGNYIQQFQTTGFDARLWELFLHVYLYNAGFEPNHDHVAPDYCLSKYGYECCIEAVTVGPSPDFDEPAPETAAEIVELSKDYLPIKYGGALFSKINRKNQYWDMEHVSGKPFVLAVHDYHGPANGKVSGSMTWSRAGLVNYLYGRRDVVEIKDGEILGPKMVETPDGFVPQIEEVETHSYKHKSIPSNFFSQPNAEYVSAVLFSNAATITTFNRMGKIAGLGGADIKMFRRGMRVAFDGNEMGFVPFSDDVDDPNFEEAWGDSIIMYHNPNALHPIDEDYFSDISHARLNRETGEVEYRYHPSHVFSSATFVLVVKEDGGEADG